MSVVGYTHRQPCGRQISKSSLVGLFGGGAQVGAAAEAHSIPGPTCTDFSARAERSSLLEHKVHLKQLSAFASAPMKEGFWCRRRPNSTVWLRDEFPRHYWKQAEKKQKELCIVDIGRRVCSFKFIYHIFPPPNKTDAHKRHKQYLSCCSGWEGEKKNASVSIFFITLQSTVCPVHSGEIWATVNHYSSGHICQMNV